MKQISFVLALTLAACGGGASVSLSARSGSAASTAAQPGTISQALTLTNGIVIVRVRIVIGDLKLERAGGDLANDADDQEFETGPFLIDLSSDADLSGSVKTVVSADVPDGTYSEVKFKIHKPDASEPGVSANAGLSAMAQLGASIVVDGTIDGASFTFTSALEVEQEFEGTFTLSSGDRNVTLNVDPQTWFGGTGAARLDPRLDASRSQIESNIKLSMKVYEDDDRDGHEDH